MSVEHVSRSGQVYYLHVKSRKNGRPNFYFSKDPEGPPVDAVPDGFEIYENIGGQVFLRRIPKKLIADDEVELTRAALALHAEKWRHKIDVKKNIVTVYETDSSDDLSELLAPWVDPAKEKEYRIRNAHYMAVLRFILTDPARRIFKAERYCFRGSVDAWIDIGPPAPLPALLKKYVKHLGKDSFYDLF
ncbi:MAG TPA: hypothetical protein VFC44_27600 [Candidatus Saccharimonadales bacterium]|nr:hypothetical protein [Candidatus Saccharimonadales bacterium]